MGLELWLVTVRWLHLLAVSLLFGAAVFPYYGMGKDTGEAYPPRGLPGLLIASALLALISGVFWFVFAEAQNETIAPVAWIRYRAISLARLALTAILIAVLARTRRPTPGFTLVAGSAVLLLSLALLGHDGTRTTAAATVRVLADSIHLLASGVWVGALFMLTLLLLRQRREVPAINDALMRFSGIGPVVVVALGLSGLANGGLIGPQNALQSFTNLYSQVLAVKIALFLLMLILAAGNRYWLTPKLQTAMNSETASQDPLRALKASLLVETFLAVLVLAAVGWLGVLPPPGTK